MVQEKLYRDSMKTLRLKNNTRTIKEELLLPSYVTLVHEFGNVAIVKDGVLAGNHFAIYASDIEKRLAF